MKEILCFHGSPGLPQDFELLSAALEGKGVIHAPAREGYPGSGRSPALDSSPRFVLGYSWGARLALEYAVQNADRVEGVILISPFVEPSERPGGLKRLLISLPILGDLLLKKAGPKSIEQFLEKSCFPARVPDFYRSQKRSLMEPAVLRRSVLEKNVESLALSELSGKLNRLPILLVRGSHDQTSSIKEQIEPIRIALVGVREKVIADAGHALVYTHAGEVAEQINNFMTKGNSR